MSRHGTADGTLHSLAELRRDMCTSAMNHADADGFDNSGRCWCLDDWIAERMSQLNSEAADPAQVASQVAQLSSSPPRAGTMPCCQIKSLPLPRASVEARQRHGSTHACHFAYYHSSMFYCTAFWRSPHPQPTTFKMRVLSSSKARTFW